MKFLLTYLTTSILFFKSNLIIAQVVFKTYNQEIGTIQSNGNIQKSITLSRIILSTPLPSHELYQTADVQLPHLTNDLFKQENNVQFKYH